MSDLKFVMLGNILVKIAYITSVTAAAIHFGKPSILWWYLLAAFLGMEYRSERDKKNEVTNDDTERKID